MSYDYFYGQSGELFSYFRIPKALFQDSRFRQLSTDARTLYGILLDRMSLSAKNNWLDEQGRVYIIYTVREVQESLCCAEHKAVKLFRELEQANPVAIVYNDEGKLTGLPLNRALRDEHGQMYDVVAGTFLVVGEGAEDFESLSPELAQKYEKHFHQPETFLKLGNRLLVIPIPDDAVKSAENKAVNKPPAEHDR